MNQYLFAIRNISDKIRKIFLNFETLQFYWQTYILSHFNNIKSNIFVVSYPKCGRTWIRIMLQRYLELVGHVPMQFKDKSILGIYEKLIIKFEHDQGNWIPAPVRIEQLSFNTSKYSNKKVVFLIRDPRDVLVSSWYHLKYRERIYNKDLSEFIRDDLVGINKIIAFMNMWIENDYIPADFLLISYEHMHKETFSCFKKLIEFIDLEVINDALKKAIENSSFEKIKKIEKDGSLNEPWMKPGTKNLSNSMKIRKGKVGSFREELSEIDIEFLNNVIKNNLSSKLPY